MGLCNIYSYLNTYKTIKLSDAYQVRIQLKDVDFDIEKNPYALPFVKPENNEIELFECTSVTLPTYKPKEDIFEYGNNSKAFVYMDPKSLDDLEIEVLEHYERPVHCDADALYIDALVNLFLSKLFDDEKFVYKLNDYIPQLTINVFKNDFSEVVMQYIFRELKLTDYTKYELDYSSTDIAKWTLKFSYRSFYACYPGEKFETDNKINENDDKSNLVGLDLTYEIPDESEVISEGDGAETPDNFGGTTGQTTGNTSGTTPGSQNSNVTNEIPTSQEGGESTGGAVTEPQENNPGTDPASSITGLGPGEMTPVSGNETGLGPGEMSPLSGDESGLGPGEMSRYTPEPQESNATAEASSTPDAAQQNGEPNDNKANPPDPETDPLHLKPEPKPGYNAQFMSANLKGVISENALIEYQEFVEKLKQTEKGKNFDETKDPHIIFDMDANRKYQIENGKIVASYVAFTSSGESLMQDGESPEGVTTLTAGNTDGKHGARYKAVADLIDKKGNGLTVDDVLQEVVNSNGSKNVRQVLNEHGINTERVTYSYQEDGKTKTDQLKDYDYNFLAYSRGGNNLIDEGNVSGRGYTSKKGTNYDRETNSGINSHNIFGSSEAAVTEYAEAVARGENVNGTELRKQLTAKGQTKGCSVMREVDLAAESLWIRQQGGKKNTVFEFKVNGTTKGNKRNDEARKAKKGS